MKINLRKPLAVLVFGALLTTLFTTFSVATGLDDGYQPGEAAPGRTCPAEALGQKTTSSYSGKVLTCTLIQGISKWWVDGEPLPAIQTPTQTSTAGPKPPTPVAANTSYLWNKSVNASSIKGSKFITIAGDRPAQVLIPAKIKPKVAAPLLVALHGFTATPTELISLMNLAVEANKRGVVLAVPSGTRNLDGLAFWNATTSCCDFNGSGVDDAAYLMGLVKSISSKVLIDQSRIYFAGHSNGGFMSYTVACSNSTKVAAIVNLEGSTYKDLSLCQATDPVSVLQINGTADELIHIEGGNVFDDPKQPYPSVQDETKFWAEVNGCESAASTVKSKVKYNFESAIAGSETTKEGYKCPKGVSVEMWTIANGRHVPKLNSSFVTAVFDFLLAHKA
jgi:polyhydroxybutyrate depolymerase